MPPETGTEETILNNLDAAESGSIPDDSQTTEDQQTAGSERQQQTTGQEGSQQTQQTASRPATQQSDTQQTTGQQKTDQPGSGDTGQQQTQIYRSGRFLTDAKGNVVDNQGNVIASAGQERRWFEQANRLQGQLQQNEQRFGQFQQELAELRAANGVAKQLGLSPQESIAAMNLMNLFKTQPIEAVKYILTQAKALGHNVDALLGQQGQQSALDMDAVRQMINTAVAPLTQAQQQSQAEADAETEATKQYNEFIGKYPDATLHEDAMVRLMNADPQLSLEAAYWQLRNWATANQFNWNQPLAQQYMAARQQAGQQQNGAQGGNGQSAPPLNAGTQTGGANQQAIQTKQSQYAHPDASFDSIVRESMAESGMKLG